MNHYNFEIKANFNQIELNRQIKYAKEIIALRNGKVDFVFVGINNKQFNLYHGIHEMYSILQSGSPIGFLEVFRNSSFNYLTIYTSPINN